MAECSKTGTCNISVLVSKSLGKQGPAECQLKQHQSTSLCLMLEAVAEDSATPPISLPGHEHLKIILPNDKESDSTIPQIEKLY